MPPSIVRAVSMLRSSPTPEGRRCYVMGHVTGCHMELPKAGGGPNGHTPSELSRIDPFCDDCSASIGRVKPRLE